MIKQCKQCNGSTLLEVCAACLMKPVKASDINPRFRLEAIKQRNTLPLELDAADWAAIEVMSIERARARARAAARQRRIWTAHRRLWDSIRKRTE
jgi:hypothetical protein